MSITDFSIVTTIDPRECMITVRGEVDALTAPRLRQALDKARRSGTTGIIVDLAEVTFMDSTGLGVLVAAYKQTADLGIPLSVRNPQPSLTRIMEITGLSSVLLVAPSPDIADDTLTTA